MSEAWILFLGTSAGFPGKGRALPSILVQYRGKYLLLDAGEGAQISLLKYGIGPSKIDAIFITHSHGDHIFGLPGLIQSMGMSSRSKPLKIIAPKSVKKFVEVSMDVTGYKSIFPIEVIEPCQIDIDSYITVSPFKTCHGEIESFGYMIKAYKTGKDRQIRFSLAYTGDTGPCESLFNSLTGAEVIIHDSTFDSTMKKEANEYGHSTNYDAAFIARKVNAKLLILFHVSNRYNEDRVSLQKEARKLFVNTYLAEDGMKFFI